MPRSEPSVGSQTGQIANAMDRAAATSDAVMSALRSMYWACIEREFCHLILAYKEIEHCQPGASPYETENNVLTGANFKRFCELWRKLPVS
jgi:hypothetical protein